MNPYLLGPPREISRRNPKIPRIPAPGRGSADLSCSLFAYRFSSSHAPRILPRPIIILAVLLLVSVYDGIGPSLMFPKSDDLSCPIWRIPSSTLQIALALFAIRGQFPSTHYPIAVGRFAFSAHQKEDRRIPPYVRTFHSTPIA